MESCPCDSPHPYGMPSLEKIQARMREENCTRKHGIETPAWWIDADDKQLEDRLELEAWKLHDTWLRSGFRYNGNRIRDWKAALRNWIRYREQKG